MEEEKKTVSVYRKLGQVKRTFRIIGEAATGPIMISSRLSANANYWPARSRQLMRGYRLSPVRLGCGL